MNDIKIRYFDLLSDYDPFLEVSEHENFTPSQMLYNLIEIRKNNFDYIDKDTFELLKRFDALIEYMKSQGIKPGL